MEARSASKAKPTAARPLRKRSRKASKRKRRFLTDPVHLLVADASERRLVKDALCHAAPARTLPRFVLETPSGLLVEGPGLCLLHAACELPLSCVAELAYEFSWKLPAAQRLPRVRRLRPADEPTRACPVRRSHRQRRRAPDGSGACSPMCATVPARPWRRSSSCCCACRRVWGGYGLPMPLLNHRVDVGRNGRKTSSNKYYVCDAFWREAWLDVEYDSDLAHTGPLRIAKDAKRRNGTASLGVTVITVTKEQAFNCDEMGPDSARRRKEAPMAASRGRKRMGEGSSRAQARASVSR